MGAGPPPQEQLDATLAWITERFAAYYHRHPPELPARFGRREFGFLWTGKKFFMRHTGFSSRQAFHEFLAREGPHHAYYSTAYYKTPHASTMKEKEWLGADLIFDLDADHLPNADKMSFEEQLREVKAQARKLLHEFLLGDFGFEPEHVRIVFSGGRGYHLHVTDPRVLRMDSAARREVVDYLSPNEQIRAHLAEGYVKEKAWARDDFGRLQKDRVIPPADAPGWDGLIARTIARFLEEVQAAGADEGPRMLRELPGVGAKTAEEVYEMLTPDRLARLRREGVIPIPSLGHKRVIQGLIDMAKVRAEGETDEPVTADIKRLIRLPGSLHGKTGLRVTPIPLDAFDRFDPLRDAVALGEEPVEVIVSKPMEIPLGGRRVQVTPGRQELPLREAMFVVLRRAALRPLPSAPTV